MIEFAKFLQEVLICCGNVCKLQPEGPGWLNTLCDAAVVTIAAMFATAAQE